MTMPSNFQNHPLYAVVLPRKMTWLSLLYPASSPSERKWKLPGDVVKPWSQWCSAKHKNGYVLEEVWTRSQVKSLRYRIEATNGVRCGEGVCLSPLRVEDYGKAVSLPTTIAYGSILLGFHCWDIEIYQDGWSSHLGLSEKIACSYQNGRYGDYWVVFLQSFQLLVVYLQYNIINYFIYCVNSHGSLAHCYHWLITLALCSLL